MYRVIKAAQVKKLHVGTKVFVIDNACAYDMSNVWTLTQYGKQKRLRRGDELMVIKDYEGKHYEIEM